ncbi:MAG: heterodisulfide reductase-related iron-sulfur binding cluster [Desulfobacterales bacterium]
MKLSFYPGCSLEGLAVDYGRSIDSVFKALGIDLVPWPVTGDLKIYDMTRFLAEPALIKEIKKRVLKPLSGLKLVCYYGCQMVRPPRITGYTDYENPQTLDRITAAVGAQVIDWSYKATCCGAGIGIGRRDIGDSLAKRLLDKARQAGAEAIVVSCPLCQSNLDMIQINRLERPVPVFYFTELIRLSFSERGNPKWFKTHFADPVPLLNAIGAI